MRSSNISRLLIFLTILFALQVCLFFASTISISTRELETNDPIEQKIIRESQQLFERVDRCDPLPCLDHFQVTEVKLLNEPVVLLNTGAAGFGIEPPHEPIAIAGVSIIESSRLVVKYPNLGRYVCRQGDYLIFMTRRNWAMIPIEDMRLCYKVPQINQ